MLEKGLFVFCIQAILLKAVLAQCIGPSLLPTEASLPIVGLAPIGPVINRVVGVNLVVDTKAPAPAGVYAYSDNLFIEGPVLVTGTLPFVGTVGLEGVLPTAGSSAVTYECGTGNIGMANY